MSGEGEMARESRRGNKRFFYGVVESGSDSEHLGDIDVSEEYEALDPDFALPAEAEFNIESSDDSAGEGPSGEAGPDELSPVKRPEKAKVGRSAKKSLSWEHHNKMLKNQGKKYESAKSKKIMAPKKIGPPCKCKNKCLENIGEEGVQCIFYSFWAIGDYNAQNLYLSSRMKILKPKRKYTKKETSDAKRYEYSVKYKENTFVVCRIAFYSVHGISEKRCMLQQKRMRESPTGTPTPDKRGKGPSANKITGERLECVYEHIESLPTTTSHYTRQRCPHRRYLGLEDGGGTLQTMYDAYCYWMENFHPDVQLVNARYYIRVFTEEFNIVFKLPKKDTCALCDRLKLEIHEGKASNDDMSEKEQTLQEHKDRAGAVQRLLSQSAKNLNIPSTLSGGSAKVRVVAMDLQQTHPCPRISTGLAYYLRKLWVYNFCVYDVTMGKPTMFVWDESTAARGSDEIASCLLKWVETRQAAGEDFDILRIYADNCAGQNKNLYMVLSALRMIHAKKLFRIEFVFLVKGHSFMPCDRSFGNIEKKLKRLSNILDTPMQYVKHIRNAVSPPFETFAMERAEFFDFKALKAHVTKRHHDMLFSQSCQLVVTMGYKEGFLMKSSYDFTDDQVDTHRCRLQKGRMNVKYSAKLFDLSTVPLVPKYTTPRCLNKDKVNDLEKLLDYVHSNAREWMRELIAEQRSLQSHGVAPVEPTKDDERHDQQDEDLENNIHDYDPPRRRQQTAS